MKAILKFTFYGSLPFYAILFSINLSMSYFILQDRNGIDKLSFLVYQACIDPHSEYIFSFRRLYPFYSHILIFGISIIQISFNFYLFFYLEEVASKRARMYVKKLSFNNQSLVKIHMFCDEAFLQVCFLNWFLRKTQNM